MFGKFLKGECKRCGQCCPGCEHVSFDEKKQAVCRIYLERPMWCAMYPTPDQKLYPNCGFHWE
jgi:Fe-S-cluster containining protein